MEQSPSSEAKKFPAFNENPKVHYRAYKSSPLVPYLEPHESSLHCDTLFI